MGNLFVVGLFTGVAEVWLPCPDEGCLRQDRNYRAAKRSGRHCSGRVSPGLLLGGRKVTGKRKW